MLNKVRIHCEQFNQQRGKVESLGVLYDVAETAMAFLKANDVQILKVTVLDTSGNRVWLLNKGGN